MRNDLLVNVRHVFHPHCVLKCIFVFTAIMCNNLTTISDGNVTYYKATNSKVISDNKQVPYGTIGNYSCNSGFKLTSGDNIRICQENQNNGTGVWSGTEPNCTGESVGLCI